MLRAPQSKYMNMNKYFDKEMKVKAREFTMKNKNYVKEKGEINAVESSTTREIKEITGTREMYNAKAYDCLGPRTIKLSSRGRKSNLFLH